ncbi:MAG: hypothetical protein WBV39_14835 [Rudaea sp.]
MDARFVIFAIRDDGKSYFARTDARFVIFAIRKAGKSNFPRGLRYRYAQD